MPFNPTTKDTGPSTNPDRLNSPQESFDSAGPAPKTSQLDRLPPNSSEAEEGVLACCFLDPSECVPVAAAGCVPESFYDLRRRAIFAAIASMADTGSPVDLITVQETLRSRGKLDDVGGLGYLSSILDKVSSSANLPEYMRILRAKLMARQLLALCSTTIASVHESTQEPDDLVSQFEMEALKIRDTKVTERSNKEVLGDFITHLNEEISGKVGVRITTGIGDFDHRFSGYKPGNLVIIAGRPSHGKTAIMLEQARHMARSIPVGIFSLEMSHEELIGRLVSSESGVNLDPVSLRYLQNSHAASGNATNPELTAIAKATGIVGRLPIHIVDKPGLSVQQIRAHSRRWVRRHGIKVVMIDYLQLVKGSSRRARDDRRLEIAEISSGCKEMAKELGIVVVMLAQLNRDIEKRGEGSRPKLSDLREAGDIEQDADWIEFLWSKKAMDDQEDLLNPEIVLSLAKQRNGPTGDVMLKFQKSCGRFLAVSRVKDDYTEPKPRHKN